MSFVLSSGFAVCEIQNFNNVQELAVSICDFLVNHPDEIPERFDDLDSDEVVCAIESYLTLNGNELAIEYNSESDGNDCYDVFDFLISHIAHLQSSPYMEIDHVSDCSREGLSASKVYLDGNGKDY